MDSFIISEIEFQCDLLFELFELEKRIDKAYIYVPGKISDKESATFANWKSTLLLVYYIK